MHNECVGLADDLHPEQLVDAALALQLHQIVQKQAIEIQKEIKTSEVMIEHTNDFFQYPLSCILTPETRNRENETLLSTFEAKLTKSTQKPQVLEQLNAALMNLVRSKSLISDICLVADEMIANAIYNAPFVSFENTEPGASRLRGEVNVPEDKYIHFFLGIDENRLVIGCRDQFGTLNVSRLLERIHNCYTKGAADMMNRTMDGGAGLGSYLIFQACLSFYAGVRKGRETLICASFPMNMRDKHRRALSKNLHLIVD